MPGVVYTGGKDIVFLCVSGEIILLGKYSVNGKLQECAKSYHRINNRKSESHIAGQSNLHLRTIEKTS